VTPSARIAAAIDLLDAIDADVRPADQVASSYWRARRFMGSKDRRAVSELVWGCLRKRARLDWWLAQLEQAPTARLRVLAALVLGEQLAGEALAALFDGIANGATELTSAERVLADRLAGHELFHHAMPPWVRGEFPPWLEGRLAAQWGDSRLVQEMGALRDEAPVDLRVNRLKADRDSAAAALAAEGLESAPTRLSPIGLRLPARTQLTCRVAFQEGLVEVQDEGSQLVALLTDARPGQAVLDYCAGAGGKTLALAATMANKGRIVALDTHAVRASKAAERLHRAGVHNVERRILESANDRWLKRQTDRFDRVLVDAPCSGSGTWRRNPDAKWRLQPARLAGLTSTQQSILDSAAKLVKPGGRLIYATCSILPEENDQQVADFQASHSEFNLLPVQQVWQDVLGGPAPDDDTPLLHLTPARNGTDGFFVAIFERPLPANAAH
jgi:16S rRNA (cytosine967-C5)-methyltransferase